MPTLIPGVELDLVACVCGHLRDEHVNAVFAPCEANCDCDDYRPAVAAGAELAQLPGPAWPRPLRDLVAAAELLGEPASAWAGRCYEIATALHRAATGAGFLTGGRVVYGHYRGPVTPDSHFGRRAAAGWIQHGWIDLGDGTVLDPTRWAFDGADPYLYQGPGADYDEGGDVLRAAMTRPCPTAPGAATTLTLGVPSATWAAAVSAGHLSHLGDGTIAGTGEQLHWLANLSRAELGDHAAAVYSALETIGLSGFIPIDNRRAVLGR